MIERAERNRQSGQKRIDGQRAGTALAFSAAAPWERPESRCPSKSYRILNGSLSGLFQRQSSLVGIVAWKQQWPFTALPPFAYRAFSCDGRAWSEIAIRFQLVGRVPLTHSRWTPHQQTDADAKAMSVTFRRAILTSLRLSRPRSYILPKRASAWRRTKNIHFHLWPIHLFGRWQLFQYRQCLKHQHELQKRRDHNVKAAANVKSFVFIYPPNCKLSVQGKVSDCMKKILSLFLDGLEYIDWYRSIPAGPRINA
jgi:hypothetical protein